MLEGLPYVAILLLLLLLLLVLFLILLFIFLFLLCASRLSTRQSKVDGTLAASPFLLPWSLITGLMCEARQAAKLGGIGTDDTS